MQASEIANLLRPFLVDSSGARFELSEAQLEQVSRHLALLVRWNQKIALTSVRDERSIVSRHFGESFFAAAQLLQTGSAIAVVDLGSGAGFPGLPLKIYAPEIALTLIESTQKKAAFLKEAARAIGLAEVSVFAGRAEQFAARADLVTLRAVERFESALEIASRIVAPGGRLALLIGEQQVPAAHASVPSCRWDSPVKIPESQHRVILVGTNHTRQDSGQ